MAAAYDPQSQLVQMISRKTGLASTSITMQSRLLHDLGLTGDDADEFLVDFAKTFSVEMNGFRFEQYFTGEPGFAHLAWSIGLRRRPIWDDKQPLTVSHLAEVAQAKRWFDP